MKVYVVQEEYWDNDSKFCNFEGQRIIGVFSSKKEVLDLIAPLYENTIERLKTHPVVIEERMSEDKLRSLFKLDIEKMGFCTSFLDRSIETTEYEIAS